MIEILVTNGSANNALVGLYLLGSISRGSVLQLEQLIEVSDEVYFTYSNYYC